MKRQGHCLKRLARGSYNKAQYLRIKASGLLSSKVEEIQLEGVILMERLLKEYVNEKTETACANEQLGEFYIHKGNIEEAEKYLRAVVLYYAEDSRSGTSMIADISLAELIVDSNQEAKYDEMYSLLTDVFESTKGKLMLNDEKYRR